MNDGVRVNGHSTHECSTNGVGHITGVWVNKDAVDDRGSRSVIAGCTSCGGTCMRCHVTC